MNTIDPLCKTFLFPDVEAETEISSESTMGDVVAGRVDQAGKCHLLDLAAFHSHRVVEEETCHNDLPVVEAADHESCRKGVEVSGCLWEEEGCVRRRGGEGQC